MNSPLDTPDTYPLGATSANIPPQPVSGGSIPFGTLVTFSSSWKKFIPTSTQQSGSEATMINAIGSTKSTTVEGPIILEPTLTSEDIDMRGESFFRFLDELEAGAYAADGITDEE